MDIASRLSLWKSASLIPSRYTLIEYVQSVGTGLNFSQFAYVKTTFKPKSNSIIRSRFQFVSKISNFDYPCFFGVGQKTTGPTQWYSNRITLGAIHGTLQRGPYYARGNNWLDSPGTAFLNIAQNWNSYIIDSTICSIYSDDGTFLKSLRGDTPTEILDGVAIFKDDIRSLTGEILNEGIGIMRCSSFSSTCDGVLEINLVPVRDGTTVGFYDTVSREFLGSTNPNIGLVGGPDGIPKEPWGGGVNS